MKTIIETFVKELNEEAVITRKMLACVPDDKFGWQPHPKSMTIKQLTTHIAELPTWVTIAINTSEIDFAQNGYNPEDLNDMESVLAYFEKNQAAGVASLGETTLEELEKPWTMRSGDKIFSIRTKAEVIRVALNQTTHHRAQLGVYLRLLDIPIPGSYGPSADEQSF